MGITIHFEGNLRDNHRFDETVRIATEYATSMGWRMETIDEPEVTLLRVGENEEDVDYTGPVRGIAIFPHENCDPVRLEFDKDLYVQEFTKTQFAGANVHIAVIKFLRTLEPLFEKLKVTDESQYWDTNDIHQLENSIDWCNQAIAEELAKDPNARLMVKTPSGRIIDLMT